MYNKDFQISSIDSDMLSIYIYELIFAIVANKVYNLFTETRRTNRTPPRKRKGARYKALFARRFKNKAVLAFLKLMLIERPLRMPMQRLLHTINALSREKSAAVSIRLGQLSVPSHGCPS